MGFPELGREREGAAYNSIAIVAPSTGELLHVYRKHFLYEVDERWALEGPSFESFDLPRLGKVMIFPRRTKYGELG